MTDKLQEILMDLQCELVAERNLVNPDQLTWVQYDILNTLRSGTAKPSLLSQQLGITRTKLSKSLVALREMNYVEQSPNINDRREMDTKLTDNGRQFLASVSKRHTELLARAQQVWDLDEQQHFIESADKLIRLLREERQKNAE